MTSEEQPVLLPPDELELGTDDSGLRLTAPQCRLIAHNVTPDGKADPINMDDARFIFIYQHGDMYFSVGGLNPEMMSAVRLDSDQAIAQIERLPYRLT